LKHLQKGLVIGVILLFIGVAVAPSVYGDIDNISSFKSSKVTINQLAKVVFNLNKKIEVLSSYKIDSECDCGLYVNTIHDFPVLLCLCLYSIALSIVAIYAILEVLGLMTDAMLDIYEFVLGKLIDIMHAFNCPDIASLSLTNKISLPTILPYQKIETLSSYKIDNECDCGLDTNNLLSYQDYPALFCFLLGTYIAVVTTILIDIFPILEIDNPIIIALVSGYIDALWGLYFALNCPYKNNAIAKYSIPFISQLEYKISLPTILPQFER